MKHERNTPALQPTEPVDQIYLRLVAAKDRDWQSRQHSYAITARAMRRYPVDRARGRPKARFVAFDAIEGALGASGSRIEPVLEVDTLLEELAGIRPEVCSSLELKFFLGLTDDESAAAMSLKLRTLQRLGQEARRWLFARVAPGDVGQHHRQ